jgi:integrase
MNAVQVQWQETKQRVVESQVIRFWAQDEWDMAHCPLFPEGTTGCWKIHFGCISPALNSELKFACRQKFERGDWPPHYRRLAKDIQPLIAWLNEQAGAVASFLEQTLDHWVVPFRSYLVERGLHRPRARMRLDAAQVPHQHLHDDTRLSILRGIYRILQDACDDRLEYDKDTWDVRKLGLSLNPSQSHYRLSFTKIRQPWLRQAAKECVRYSLSIHSLSYTYSILAAIQVFSGFLDRFYPDIEASGIDRALIVAYIGYLSSQGFSESRRASFLSRLRMFLELCGTEEWLNVSQKQLIYDDDLPKRRASQPRFIPEDVLAQLNQHLDALPIHYKRMVIILQECGMRVSELCSLPLDCLRQDVDSDWWLHFYIRKMKKEHSVPLLNQDIVAVIQEQQQEVRRKWGGSVSLLFPNAKGHPRKQISFIQALNKLGHEQDIRDSARQLWQFEPHQFRHTVGTRMINNGVPQHIVQRQLGHESPEMTSVYAHIHDQTLKQEFEKFRGKLVNNTGKLVDLTADPVDLQWFKRNILAQALPNGHCFLPIMAGPCPHANACLTCTHFRTDARFLAQHKAQLEETQRLLQVAQQNGWIRQLEMNERVKDNLERIILTLEQKPP